MAGHARRRRGYFAGAFLLQVASWAALLGFGALLVGGIVLPKAAGATPYTVLTGSMRPALPPGSLVVVRPVDPQRIRIGDVITYQVESGRSEVVTHRVVAVGTNGAGEQVFRTQGDANSVADSSPIREVQVRGRVWYAVPWVGHVAVALDGRTRAWLTSLAAGGLLAYATAMFLGAFRDRRPRLVGRHRRGVPA